MIAKTRQAFHKLPQNAKNLVALFWVYSFVNQVANIFFGVLVYEQTQSLQKLIFFTMTYMVAIAVAFIGGGALASIKRHNLKFYFMAGYLFQFAGYAQLFFAPESYSAYLIYALISGAGAGLFWLCMHSYELEATTNKNRDFYSSMLSTGSQSFSIMAPLIGTLLFILAQQLSMPTPKLLLAILPIVFLISIPFLKKLPEQIPEKLDWLHIKKLATDPALKAERRYSFLFGIDWPMWTMVVPVIALVSLKNVINLGILETIMAILGLITVVTISHWRKPSNRVKVLAITYSIWLSAMALMIFFEVSPIFYILHSLVVALIQPSARVSEHTIDLQSMEHMRKKENANIFEGILFRETILFFGRMAAFGLILPLTYFLYDELTVKINIIIYILVMLGILYFAKQVMAKAK